MVGLGAVGFAGGVGEVSGGGVVVDMAADLAAARAEKSEGEPLLRLPLLLLLLLLLVVPVARGEGGVEGVVEATGGGRQGTGSSNFTCTTGEKVTDREVDVDLCWRGGEDAREERAGKAEGGDEELRAGRWKGATMPSLGATRGEVMV